MDTTMRSGLAILTVLGGFFVYRFVHPSTSFAQAGLDPAWDAAVQARDGTEPTLVIVTAGWCGPCQALHADALSRSDVRAELSSHYNVHTVDLTNPSESVQAQAARLGVSTIPTLIRYDVQGRETSRTHGQSADDLLNWLKAGE